MSKFRNAVPASESSDSVDSSRTFLPNDDDEPKTATSRRVGCLDTVLNTIWPSRLEGQISILTKREKRRIYARRILYSTILITLVTSLAIMTWLAIVLTVANRLSARLDTLDASSGLNTILQTYRAPTSSTSASPLWLPDFSAGVLPVQCHSHNDYWHRIPLYEGLAAGCVSTEADIWARPSGVLNGTTDLFVGHNEKSLTASRTLRSLYLDPIYTILSNQNTNTTSMNGVFEISPNTSLVILLDFKTSDSETWNLVVEQLSRLRSAGWLTYWTPISDVVSRPVTVVATGDAPLSSIIANNTYRDIFYDAPLTSLSTSTFTEPYHSNNSYYASASLKQAVGKTWFGKLTTSQRSTVESQVKEARERGLRSRYWDTVAWPVSWRNRMWKQLVEIEGIGEDGVTGGVLNIDELKAGARWDWSLCVVGGANVCGSRRRGREGWRRDYDDDDE